MSPSDGRRSSASGCRAALPERVYPDGAAFDAEGLIWVAPLFTSERVAARRRDRRTGSLPAKALRLHARRRRRPHARSKICRPRTPDDRPPPSAPAGDRGGPGATSRTPAAAPDQPLEGECEGACRIGLGRMRGYAASSTAGTASVTLRSLGSAAPPSPVTGTEVVALLLRRGARERSPPGPHPPARAALHGVHAGVRSASPSARAGHRGRRSGRGSGGRRFRPEGAGRSSRTSRCSFLPWIGAPAA